MRKAQAAVSSRVFGAWVAASLTYRGSCSQQSWVSELLPVLADDLPGLTTSQGKSTKKTIQFLKGF